MLDLTNLLDDAVDPYDFFEKNYQTDGMKRLFREAFRRLAGESSQGVFVLSQAMDGDKTHNMIALGLLAGYPEVRQRVLENAGQFSHLKGIRVVGFSGRESDAQFGIWGSIASRPPLRN